MGDDAGALSSEDEISRLQQQLALSHEERAREKEENENKLQDLRQKTKDHMTKFQAKMQAVIQQKDTQLQELEAAKEDAMSEITALKAAQPGDSSELTAAETARANAAEARSKSLEQDVSALKEKLCAQEEKLAQFVSNAGAGEQGDATANLALQEAQSQRDVAHADAEAVKAQLAELQEEFEKSRQETQAKIGEVVQKAKDHVKQVQSRLDAQVSENKQLLTRLEGKETENKELTDKFREVDDAYASQQEKLNKYKQLMAQANARIEDGDESARETKESFQKLQEDYERLKQMHDAGEKMFTPPSKAEIADAGGILLTVEAENDDVWCLLGAGGGAPTEQSSSVTSRQRWWLSSQLDVDDKPIPLQRRWKGEVVALRAQTARANKKGQDLQDEFEAYKQKANAALQNGAVHSEEILVRERRFEQLGQQLQATASELQQVQAEKAKVFEDLGEVRRRLQEASSQRSEVERTLDHRIREAQQAQEAALADCRKSFEIEKEDLMQKWREKERSYLQEIDLRRAQKEDLDEEIESLRGRLASRLTSTAFASEVVADQDSAATGDAALPSVGTSSPSRHGLDNRLAASPLDEGRWHVQPSQEASPRPSPRSGEPPAAGNSSLPSSGQPPAAGQTDLPPQSGSLPIGGEEATTQALPPQAYSLHASVAWQDLVSLRAQVRQLEATLQDQRHQHASLEREKEGLVTEMREVEEQQRLQNVVGQHQQMEYIRNVFRKFVESLPAGQAEQEQLIPVLMTFFQFAPDETRTIQNKRPKSQGLWNQLSGWRG